MSAPLSTRAVHVLERIGVTRPTKRAVRRVLPQLRAGVRPDYAHRHCIRDLGPKTLAEIETWLRPRGRVAP